MHHAGVRLEVPGPTTLVAALAPEQGPDGSRTRYAAEDGALVIEVEATDLATLRAALQGVLRLADAAARTAR